jgi:hypothetical protein
MIALCGGLLDHIHTTWIWYLVVQVTPPIAGGPEAGGVARVSPNPWRAKGDIRPVYSL